MPGGNRRSDKTDREAEPVSGEAFRSTDGVPEEVINDAENKSSADRDGDGVAGSGGNFDGSGANENLADGQSESTRKMGDNAPVVKPVPQPKLRLVNPVPRQSKKQKRATGSTGKKTSNVQPVPQSASANDPNRIHPPTLSGYKWKPSGLTGWELYSRKPSISASGKRSSKAKYIAYYSQQAVERMIHEREKAANVRTA